MAENGPPQYAPLVIETHRDFRRHMKEIVDRMNSNPDLARLTMVNPLYALEDLGVQLSKEMQQHVFETFHNPPAKQRRLAELDKEIREHLDQLPGKPGLPATPEARAELVFKQLGLQPAPGDREDRLERNRLASYAHRHPLVQKLVEYDIVRRSGLTFHPRMIYDAYRRGELKQNWVQAVRFGAPPPPAPEDVR